MENENQEIQTEVTQEVATEQALSVEQETKETEKTFTQEDLTRIATKEAKKTEQAFLKQLGIEKKEDIANILEDLKAVKEAKESKKTETEKMQAVIDEYETFKTTHTEVLSELTQLKQEKLLSSKNIPEKDMDYYLYKINQLVSDEVTFEEAIDLYLKENPIQEKLKPAPMYAGSGTTAIQKEAEDDAITNALKKGAGLFKK